VEDLTKFRPEELVKIIGDQRVDVIVGGPPCQGFSTARQRDGANHGKERFIEDSRRQLYQDFLRYVEFFQPKVFVIENVLGLKSAAGGVYFTRVQNEARALGYRIVPQVADAFALGVPQKRRRQLIIGVREDLPGFFPKALNPAPRALVGTTLGSAIGDLPRLAAGNGNETRDYDVLRRDKYLERHGELARHYLYNVLEIERAERLTAHRARPHSDRDLRDFALLSEGENSAEAMKRGVEFEFPYDKESFKDRYTRQSRFEPCSTIVAHLSKDGLMFIHPTQNRSLTPREAARIQSFPDWFQFPVARTHQFRLIGNAVAPLVAEAVALEVRAFLEASSSDEPRVQTHRAGLEKASDASIPQTQRQAAEWLQEIGGLDRHQLRSCAKTTFLRGWFALFFLFPDLDPDNALDHGDSHDLCSHSRMRSPDWGEFTKRRFARSGWPVTLELLGHEAWRRHGAGELASEELYCTKAQEQGLLAQPSSLIRRGRPAAVTE
jgi:DNA (cytosine-5)-methyltransferase 1